MCLSRLQPVDFSWNTYADQKFDFLDHSLVACIRSKKDKDTLEFFKLLSLCHTVMVEQKEGEHVKPTPHIYISSFSRRSYPERLTVSTGTFPLGK